MNPTHKRILTTTGSAAGIAGLVGAAAHVGQYAALGFLDTKLSQAARAGKEFVPDGIRAVLGTLNRLATTIFTHPVIAALVAVLCGLLLWGLHYKRRVTPAVFIAVFIVVVLLTIPAFELFDLLRQSLDPGAIPSTHFARAFLRPVVEGMMYSRIRPPASLAWRPDEVRSALNTRYVVLVASTLYLALLALLALPDHVGVRRMASALVIISVVATSYYWGAVEEDTSYRRTVALDGHARHPEHAAFLIATVGYTCSLYSFEYGNEDVECRLTDTDEERKEDILLARLLRP